VKVRVRPQVTKRKRVIAREKKGLGKRVREKKRGCERV
jgi:hypothetical protein